MNTAVTSEVSVFAYTDGDYDRLGTMKKAADVVFAYFRWVVEDHRRLLVERDHQSRILQLVSDVSQVFGFTDDKEQLVRYFIANVLQGAQEVEFEALGNDSWSPFTLEALLAVYDQRELVEMLEDLPLHDRCMYAGRFVAECTSSAPQVEQIDLGEIVGCDVDLVQTATWEILLETFDIEDDHSFICVGKAVMRSRELTQLHLNDIEKLL